MKNRLLQYLQPEQAAVVPVVKSAKPRKATKGKRICVCRFQSYYSTPEKDGTYQRNGGPKSITVGVDGDYRALGGACTPKEALRVFCVWKFGGFNKHKETYIDRLEMERLCNLALPQEECEPPPAQDDNEGEEWKAE